MKSLNLKGLILASLFCILLTSCSGGGGMSAGGGIDGTGIMSAGVVTAFGSIVVNGTEFDTTKASVIVNGVELVFSSAGYLTTLSDEMLSIQTKIQD